MLDGVTGPLEISPPLYFVFAWICAKIGDPHVWVRVPALVAGVALVPAAYALGVRTVGRTAALIGAALLALSPFAVFYSTEARAYTLATLFVVLAAARAAGRDGARRMAALGAVRARGVRGAVQPLHGRDSRSRPRWPGRRGRTAIACGSWRWRASRRRVGSCPGCRPSWTTARPDSRRPSRTSTRSRSRSSSARSGSPSSGTPTWACARRPERPWSWLLGLGLLLAVAGAVRGARRAPGPPARRAGDRPRARAGGGCAARRRALQHPVRERVRAAHAARVAAGLLPRGRPGRRVPRRGRSRVAATVVTVAALALGTVRALPRDTQAALQAGRRLGRRAPRARGPRAPGRADRLRQPGRAPRRAVPALQAGLRGARHRAGPAPHGGDPLLRGRRGLQARGVARRGGGYSWSATGRRAGSASRAWRRGFDRVSAHLFEHEQFPIEVREFARR